MFREIQNGKNIFMSNCVCVCRFRYFESLSAFCYRFAVNPSSKLDVLTKKTHSLVCYELFYFVVCLMCTDASVRL